MELLKNVVSSGRNKTDMDDITLSTANTPNKSFKERNSLTDRIAAVENIRVKFPNKVPVIVERYKKVRYINACVLCYRSSYCSSNL